MTALTTKMLMLPDGRMVALRTATPADADGILALTKAEREQDWIEQHENDPRRLLLVAESDHQIIALLEFGPLPRATLGHVGELHLSIDPQWQGLGIGGSLLEGMLDWVRNVDGIQKITLSVPSDNALAIKLYTKRGFKEEGRRVGQVSRRNGAAGEELLMYRTMNAE